MNRHMHKESLPHSADYLDIEGDVRHADDNPAGFSAEGASPRSGDGTHERTDARPVEDSYYEELAEQDGMPGVAVDIGSRARYLLVATEAFAHASMLAGLIDSGDRKKITQYNGEPALRRLINKEFERGRNALWMGTGLDAMVRHPHVFADEGGSPYTERQALDELNIDTSLFTRKYTGYGTRRMSREATAKQIVDSRRATDQARHDFRQQLAAQLINKTQS